MNSTFVAFLTLLSLCLPSFAYKASVYEHKPLADIESNLRVFERVSKEASKAGSKIIVFPEYGLYAGLRLLRPFLKSNCINLDQLKTRLLPCDDAAKFPVSNSTNMLTRLSCMAKNAKIYVTVNFCSFKKCENNCREDNVHIYNTNFVFDDLGRIVTFYRKFHLYGETRFDAPATFDETYFITEFDTFGTFTCFDIMFNESANFVKKYPVNTILFPSLWIEAYPLYISIDIQRAWAAANNVNLLAANIHSPATGDLGSGIFTRNASVYVYDPQESKSTLITADVNKLSRGYGMSEKRKFPLTKRGFMFKLDLSRATKIVLKDREGWVSVENNGLKCSLGYRVKSFFREKYFFAALNGSLTTNNKKHGWSVELCLLYTCNDPSCKSFVLVSKTGFPYLRIEGNFSDLDMFPSMVSNFDLPNLKDWKIGKKYMFSKSVFSQNIHYLALYGRNYLLDKP